MRASAQKIPRHGSETQSAMSRIARGGVAAKRQFFGRGARKIKLSSYLYVLLF